MKDFRLTIEVYRDGEFKSVIFECYTYNLVSAVSLDEKEEGFVRVLEV